MIDYDDEICVCGHSKGYHQKHNLDSHGGGCERCECDCYTWDKFVAYTEPKKIPEGEEQ